MLRHLPLIVVTAGILVVFHAPILAAVDGLFAPGGLDERLIWVGMLPFTYLVGMYLISGDR